jgi:hypothetical protein
MSKEAMTLALDALIVCRQSNYGRNWYWPDTAIETALNNVFEAIKALEEALAKEPAPVQNSKYTTTRNEWTGEAATCLPSTSNEKRGRSP